MRAALIAALIMGAASTAGDMLWEGLSLRHRMAYGLVHGALICLLIGGLVGWRSGRMAAGVGAGPVIGLLAAAAFYALAPLLGYSAMFPAWMFFWVCFALLQKALRRDAQWGPALLRGLTASVISGLAFYLISGIWTRPSPGGRNYLYHFLAWSFAFLPGFLALFAWLPRGPSRREPAPHTVTDLKTGG